MLLHVVVVVASCSQRNRASTTNTTTSGGIADTISNAASYVSETVQETLSGASKEGNKVRRRWDCSIQRFLETTQANPARTILQEVAKGNTNASLSDRASAGFSAVGDKIDESSQFVPLSPIAL